jgi:hypothetical protein
MDFFQFLQKSTNDSDRKSKRKTKSTLNNTNLEPTNSRDKYEPTNSRDNYEPTNSRDIEQNRNIEQNHLYIKRGDIVKIVNVQNSLLNVYKGYIGEIKNYKKDQDFALVFLHAPTSVNIIKFPLLHLIKYNHIQK